jgi:hypothetical protein
MSEMFGTPEALFETFRTYHLAVWPMQIITYVLGIAGVILAIRKTKASDKIISGILAFLWLWSGIVFSLMFFGRVTPIFYFGGVALVVQGLLLFMFGFGVGLKPSLSFKFHLDSYCIVGAIMILYAMVIYPIIGHLSGHAYPRGPIFGVAPCPNCIFTFGLLLMTDRKVPPSILIIPLLWSLMGIAAAKLGIFEDIGLVITGIAGTVLILSRNKTSSRVTADRGTA